MPFVIPHQHGSVDLSSHPINPLRVIALDVFHRSETFINDFDQDRAATYTESSMEEKIDVFMIIMEPKYLSSNDEGSKKIKETIFLASYAIASADGKVDQHLSRMSACNIIRDLTVVALPDGELSQPEIDRLCYITYVPPWEFIPLLSMK